MVVSFDKAPTTTRLVTRVAKTESPTTVVFRSSRLFFGPITTASGRRCSNAGSKAATTETDGVVGGRGIGGGGRCVVLINRKLEVVETEPERVVGRIGPYEAAPKMSRGGCEPAPTLGIGWGGSGRPVIATRTFRFRARRVAGEIWSIAGRLGHGRPSAALPTTRRVVGCGLGVVGRGVGLVGDVHDTTTIRTTAT